MITRDVPLSDFSQSFIPPMGVKSVTEEDPISWPWTKDRFSASLCSLIPPSKPFIIFVISVACP